MKTLLPIVSARRISAHSRARLLATFERSGMSAAAFARQYHINYTTFCGWRQRQAKRAAVPFAQVELPAPVVPAHLVVELGSQARLRLDSEAQLPLAARLLQHLNPSQAC